MNAQQEKTSACLGTATSRRTVLTGALGSWLVSACGGGSSSAPAPNPGSGSGTGTPTSGFTVESISNSSPAALDTILVTLKDAGGVTPTASISIAGQATTVPVVAGPSANSWNLIVPLYATPQGAQATSGYAGALTLRVGTQEASVPLNVQNLRTIAELGMPLGRIERAYFTYLQLSVGRSLNALQVMRYATPMGTNSTTAAALDAGIASRQRLLQQLALFSAACEPLIQGTASTVTVGTNPDGTPVLLDAAGLAQMESVLAVVLLKLSSTLLSLAPASALHEDHPLLTSSTVLASMDTLASTINLAKNTLRIDNMVSDAVRSGPAASASLADSLQFGAAVTSIYGTLKNLPGATALANNVARYTGAAVALEAIGTNLGNAAGSLSVAVGAAMDGDSALFASEAANFKNYSKQVAFDTISGFLKYGPLGAGVRTASGFADEAAKALASDAEVVPAAGDTLTQTPSLTGATVPVSTVAPTPAGSTTPATPQPSTLLTLGPDGKTVQGVTDANGQALMCVPDAIGKDPSQLTQNDLTTGKLQGATPVTPGQASSTGTGAGKTITVVTATCGAAGSYSGGFSGDDAGPASVTISANGTLTASASSSRFNTNISATGTVGTRGSFQAVGGTTSGGAVFNGVLSSSKTGWSISGTWQNPNSKLSGAFAVAQANCA